MPLVNYTETATTDYSCNVNPAQHWCTGNSIPGKPDCLASMLTLPRCLVRFFFAPRFYRDQNPPISAKPRSPQVEISRLRPHFYTQSFICFIVALCSRFIIIMANTFYTSSLSDGPLLMTRLSIAKHCELQCWNTFYSDYVQDYM